MCHNDLLRALASSYVSKTASVVLVLLLLGCRKGMVQELLCVDMFRHKMTDKYLKNRCP